VACVPAKRVIGMAEGVVRTLLLRIETGVVPITGSLAAGRRSWSFVGLLELAAALASATEAGDCEADAVEEGSMQVRFHRRESEVGDASAITDRFAEE
jgi:hypothetical protein